jgi:hypothetical protein
MPVLSYASQIEKLYHGVVNYALNVGDIVSKFLLQIREAM